MVQPLMYSECLVWLFLVVTLGVVAVAIAIAVAISVAITIAVAAIFAGDVFRAVEEYTELVVFLLVVEFFYILQDAAVHQSGSYDEDSHVGVFLHDTCIGYNLNGRTVKDD